MSDQCSINYKSVEWQPQAILYKAEHLIPAQEAASASQTVSSGPVITL